MDLNMSAFEQRLRVKARRERHPLSCVFEVTPTCNLRCHFCYVALDPYRGPYLSTDAVHRVLDVLEGAGVLWLTLTGGEVFSRRDFAEIYRYAKRKGFLLTLYSNATMVTPEIAQLLADLPPFSMEVSIYGADAEHYEATTGIKGSFARFERGVDLLQAAGVALSMKCPITTLTADHVPALVGWCKARGLPFKFDVGIDARHDGGQEPTLYRIESKAVAELRRSILALSDQGAPEGPLPECASRPPGVQNDELYQCGAGRVGVFVDGLGQVSHCVIDREPSFPILEMPWSDIWQQMGEWVTQPLPKEAPCSGCDMRTSCKNCPARSRLSTGSPYLKDTYYCDVTHEKYGLPLADHPDYRAVPRPLAACAT